MIPTPHTNNLSPDDYAMEILTKDFWYAETRQLCVEYIEGCRSELPSLDKLTSAVLPKARLTIPIEVKSELVEYVYNYLVNNSNPKESKLDKKIQELHNSFRQTDEFGAESQNNAEAPSQVEAASQAEAALQAEATHQVEAPQQVDFQATH